jgi:NAD(P)-dependent dehydrogenase (short-subunit alcohol dehydrogenase family)
MADDLSGKIALVTGASRGIGYHLALQLAEAGAHVIAVARTQGGLEDLDDQIKSTGGSATLVPLNLMDGPGIDRLGGAIYERWGKLDIFCANAAILGVIAPIGHIEAKVFDRVMATNVTATWRMIRTLDPLLRLSDAGRAAIISTYAGLQGRAFWSAYAASKAAVDTFARSWADETKELNLRVNVVDPGVARTAMRAQAVPGEDPSTLPMPAEVAHGIMPVFATDLKVTGQLWSVPAQRFQHYQLPV